MQLAEDVFQQPEGVPCEIMKHDETSYKCEMAADGHPQEEMSGVVQ